MAKVDVSITDKVSWLLSKPKRVKIAVGGRGSAKSIGVGDIMLMFADHGERVCCAREFQNSIDDSVHEGLSQEITRLELKGFTVLNSEIRSSSDGKIFYKGLARNITSLKSLAGVKRLWIEEGESVSDKSLRVLTPSIRSSAAANEDEDEEPPEIWITMNRGSTSDPVAKKYLKRAEKSLRKTGYYEDDMIMVVEINYRDNPWFPPELEQERKDDEENLSQEEYDHIWEGHYNDSVPNAIIKAEWFDACIDAHIKLGFKPQGVEVVAHDPSDEGEDSKGLAYRHGSVCLDVQENENGDINDGGDWASDYALGVKPDVFTFDADGMGIGLKRQFYDAFNEKKIELQMYRGSASPDNPDRIYDDGSETEKQQKTNKEAFRNKRAQAYWLLRDRCYRTWKAVTKGVYIDPSELISFSSAIENIELLRAELCRIPLKPNGAGMIQIMTKVEMKKIGIDSPNMADSVAMAFSVEMDHIKKAAPTRSGRSRNWRAL